MYYVYDTFLKPQWRESQASSLVKDLVLVEGYRNVLVQGGTSTLQARTGDDSSVARLFIVPIASHLCAPTTMSTYVAPTTSMYLGFRISKYYFSF